MMAREFVNNVIMVLLSLLVIFATNCTAKRLKTRLIYHSSRLSPFFNATATLEDRCEREMDIFNARIKHLNHIHERPSERMVAPRPSIGAIVKAQPPQTPLFMVDLEIGESPVAKLVALDTGSSLLWIRCYGTNSDNHYQPYKSSTYKNLLCGAPLCGRGDPYNTCTADDDFTQLCYYGLSYYTGFSEGVLAKEKFRFFTDLTDSVVPDILFGCAYNATLPFKVEYDGVLGLGPQSTSIVNQTEYSGFSYCLGNLSDPEHLDNFLIIEDNPLLIKSPYTPLFIEKGHYGAKLEGISVAGEMLHVTMPVGGEAVAIIDTGATYSILTEAAYPKFEEAIIKSIGWLLTRSYRFENMLCYEGNLQRDLDWFPTVTFHFLKGAFMDFGYEHLFHQRRPNVICLAVYSGKTSIIGVRLQQYFLCDI